MTTKRLRNGSPLARLLADPRQFSFDAAVRVLTFRRRVPRRGSAQPMADPADALRFGSVAGVAFAGAEVTFVQDAGVDDPGPPRVTVGLMGLTGPSGVLPRHYSAAVVTSQRARSTSLAAFFDVLSHRMVGFFASAGAKYRPHRDADCAALATAPSSRGITSSGEIAEALLALTGYGIPGFAERLPTGAAPLRHYAGFFSARPRSADRLEALASDWLARPVRVQQFAGAWLSLPPDQRTRLPVGLAPGAFGQLGLDAAIGIRAWDQQARIVLRIGPLDQASFDRLLPDGAELRQLVSLVRAYVGFEVGFAVNLVLAKDAIPPLVLDSQAAPPPRLGWNTWATQPGSVRRRQDAADPVFEAEIVESQPPAVQSPTEREAA